MKLSDDTVECIKNVDWTKEFSSYHIKWNVGVITDEDLDGRKYSTSFRIPPSDKSKKRNGTLVVDLGMWIPKENTNADLKVDVDADFPLPIIHRFALSHKDQEIFFTKSHMELKLEDDGDLLVYFDGSLLKRDGHLIVHCWMDIPTAIINDIDAQSECYAGAPRLPWNVRNFLKKSEELYKSVIGENQESMHSDVKLVLKKSIKPNGIFHCHRIILADASPMFATMFSVNQWKEGEDGSVDIDDVDEDTMMGVLYHIYTGKFKEVESDELPDLIYAADKYQLKDLKAWAEIQMMAAEYMDSERIDCLVFAERHQLHQLQAVCIAMLSTNIRLLGSDEFKEKLSKEVQEEIFKAAEKRQMNATQIIGN